MASFTPSKKTAQDFNNGVEYVNQDLENHIQGDKVQAETINNLVENALYTQEAALAAESIAINQPDTSEVANVGTPSVEIIVDSDGVRRLKFSNLKGNKGETFYIFNNDEVSYVGYTFSDLELTDFTPNFAQASLKYGDVFYGISKSGALVKIEPHFDEDTFTHFSAEVLGYAGLKNGGTTFGDIDLNGNALLGVGSLEIDGKTITAVDENLSATSANPVENKAVTAEVNHLTEENLLQSYQIADLKRIVYDTVISDEDYTFENLTIANHPTHIADDSGNYHTVLPDGETMLMEVSGKSVKSINLLKNTLTSITANGVTATVNSDGSITFNGIATGASNFYIGEVELNAGTYYIPIKNKSEYVHIWLGSAQSTNDILNAVINADRLTFTLTDTTQRTRVYFEYVLDSEQTYDNFTVYPFLTDNSSAVADDYKLYFDGLKSTTYQALQVNGADGQPTATIASLLESIELKSAVIASDKLEVRDKGNGFYRLVKVENTAKQRLVVTNQAFVKQSDYSKNTVCIITNALIKSPFNEYGEVIGITNDYQYSVKYMDNVWGRDKTIGLDEYNNSIYIYNNDFSTVQEFIDYFNNNEVYIIYQISTPVETVLADNLTETDIATLIQKNGSIQLIGNTEEEFVQPNVTMLYQVEKAIES